MQKDSLKIRLLKHLSPKRHCKQWLTVSMATLLLISFSTPAANTHNTHASNIHTIQTNSDISDPSTDYFTNFGNQIQSGFNNQSDYQRFMNDLENKAPNTLGNGSNGTAWANYFRTLQQDTNNTNYSSSALNDFKNNLGLAVGTFAARSNNMYSSQTLENKVAEYSEGFFSLLTTDQANELDSFFSGLSNHQIYHSEINSETANQQNAKASVSASASTMAKRAASSASVIKLRAASASTSAKSKLSSSASNVIPKPTSKVRSNVSSASSKASSAQSVASSAKQKSSAASSASSIIRSQVSSASHTLSIASSSIKHTQSAHSQSSVTMPSSSANSLAANNYNLLTALNQLNISSAKSASNQATAPKSATNTNHIYSTATKRPVAHKRTHHHSITKHHNMKRHVSKKYLRKQRRHARLIAYLHKHYWTNSSIKHSHYIKITRYCKLYRTTRHHKRVVIKRLYRGMTLYVKRIFRHGHTNKFKVSKHTYVTANRKFVRVLHHKPIMKHIYLKR